MRMTKRGGSQPGRPPELRREEAKTVSLGGGEGSQTGLDTPDASLEQIRLILFGQQMREFDRKLQGLETRFQENASQMNAGLLERIAGLEKHLTALFEQESQERQIADTALQNSLDSATSGLENKLASEMRETRAELRDQGKETSRKVDALGGQLEAAIAELRLQKTDRKALADLLGNAAEKLRKD